MSWPVFVENSKSGFELSSLSEPGHMSSAATAAVILFFAPSINLGYSTLRLTTNATAFGSHNKIDLRFK